MHGIAFITRQPPHGSAIARETQDAILATSALTEDLSVFFVGDGIYQLLKEQAPQQIGTRNFATTFKLFDLYDIENIYVCQESLAMRGIDASQLLIEVTYLSAEQLNAHIRKHAKILNF